jgi:hypothetical protein
MLERSRTIGLLADFEEPSRSLAVVFDQENPSAPESLLFRFLATSRQLSHIIGGTVAGCLHEFGEFLTIRTPRTIEFNCRRSLASISCTDIYAGLRFSRAEAEIHVMTSLSLCGSVVRFYTQQLFRLVGQRGVRLRYRRRTP